MLLFFISKSILNFNVNCIPFRNTIEVKSVGEFLKEVSHNNKTLVSTLDLQNHVVMLNYDKNREHFFKLFGLGGTLNYGVPKFFFELDGRLCTFFRIDPRSHFHLNLNYLGDIYSNFVFTHSNNLNNFSLISKEKLDLFGVKRYQYISNNLHFYSNVHIPKFYDLNNYVNNRFDFNQTDLKKADLINKFIISQEKFLIEHTLNAYDLKYSN